MLRLPDTLEGVKADGDSSYARHLFGDEAGQFWTKLGSSWETAVLEKELENKNVLFWLRNLPRKPWAMCFPYKMNGEHKPCFPDFLFVRQTEEGLVCDIIDPHRLEQDAHHKAVGMAEFAEKHGFSSCFGRIELVAEVGGQLKRIDLMDSDKCAAVKKIGSLGELEQLYRLA